MQKRILLVDDDINLLQGLRRTLQTIPDQWEPVLAVNGQDALRLLEHTPCEVVMTDILMPEQDGIEMIQELRRRFPTVQVIAISGGGRIGTQHVLRLAAAFGAHRTLAKPFTREEFLAAIRGVLLDREAQRDSIVCQTYSAASVLPRAREAQ